MSVLDKILDYLVRDGYGTPIGYIENLPAAREELRALRAENEAMRDELRRLRWNLCPEDVASVDAILRREDGRG